MRLSHAYPGEFSNSASCASSTAMKSRSRRKMTAGVSKLPRTALMADSSSESERRATTCVPLIALGGTACELPRNRDVADELHPQAHGGRRYRGRRAAEISRDRRLERRPGSGDAAEIGGAARLHVLADRTVVSNQLLEHQIRRTGDRLVLVLHAAHRIECL